MKFDTLNDFSTLMGVGIIVVNENAEKKFSTSILDKSDAFLSYLDKLLDNGERGKVALIDGCYQAMRFGGRYTFMCPNGFVWVVSTIIRNEENVLSAVAGPILMTSIDDYLEFDIGKKVSESDIEELRLQLKNVPQMEPEKIALMAEQLFVNASYLGKGRSLDQEDFFPEKTYATTQAMLKENFDAYVDSHLSEENVQIINEERKLIEALESHDVKPARELLNELMGRILFHSGKNLEFIKSRILELVVLLSRAAIKDGADSKLIGDIKNNAYSEIDEQENFEELIIWLNNILDRFKNHIFVDPSSKHANIIKTTVNYLIENYGEKITLEDLAKRVFLSPTYFSRLFKEETGYSFTNYLNRVRISKSKDLLTDATLSVAEVSALVGFEDQSYFTKVFKSFEGVSPNKYRGSK